MLDFRVRKRVSELTPSKRLVLFVDLVGFARWIDRLPDEVHVFAFLDDYYSLCDAAFSAHGGELVKHLWDGCVGVFDADQATAALAAYRSIESSLPAFQTEYGLTDLRVRGGAHVGDVLVAEFGSRRLRDALGKGIATAIAQQGRGLVVTEPVYRSLPNHARSGWKKERSPAVYRAAS